MIKTDINPLPEFFDRYINLVADIELLDALEVGTQEIGFFELDTLKTLGDKVYAEGKWTAKDILQHLIDTERIFCYRALCFARGETIQLPSFDEDNYAANANAAHRTFEDLLAEMTALRKATIGLFASFSDEILLKTGLSFKGSYSVLAIGFILVGHQRWHFNVLKEKYFSLL